VSTVLVLQAHPPKGCTLVLIVRFTLTILIVMLIVTCHPTSKKHNRWIRNYVITLFLLFILYKDRSMD